MFLMGLFVDIVRGYVRQRLSQDKPAAARNRLGNGLISHHTVDRPITPMCKDAVHDDSTEVSTEGDFDNDPESDDGGDDNSDADDIDPIYSESKSSANNGVADKKKQWTILEDVRLRALRTEQKD
ncbi:hypothetical protein DL765_010985 [Monosporascus sp. GIB2]|nr:hypothetical protein DL765_010985 [Monosporascus sp. GIB2]